MKTHERRHSLAAAVLLSALGVAGCASSIAGNASFGGSAPSTSSSGGITLPSSAATSSPPPSSSGGESSSPPPSSGSSLPPSSPVSTDVPSTSASGGGDGTGFCSLVSDAQLKSIFGGMPTKKSSLGGCDYTYGSLFIPVAEFSTFDVTSQKTENGGGTDITVAGHPGAVLHDGDVVVSETKSAASGGVVKAYTSTAEEQAAAKKLLAIVVVHFAH